MDVQSFAKRLRQSRSRLGLTQMQLADMVGVKRGTLNNWERGRSYPEVSQLICLCRALGVTPEYLLDVETFLDPQSLLADSHYELQRLQAELASCEPRRRRWVLDSIDRVNRRISFLSEARKSAEVVPSQQSVRTVPLLGSIRAGIPTYAEELREGEIEVPRGIEADFALRVNGDSLTGLGIFEGDVAICRLPSSEPPIGRIVVALVDNMDATLKVLTRKNGCWVLRAAHPNYPDIAINGNNDIIQGIVTAILRDVDRDIDPDQLPIYELVSKETGVPAGVIKAFLAAYASMDQSKGDSSDQSLSQ